MLKLKSVWTNRIRPYIDLSSDTIGLHCYSDQLHCQKQPVWCCLPDSQPHTQHINRLLSEPPTYYWGRLLSLVL